MQVVDKRTLLIIILITTTISGLFCLIGLVTPGWGGFSIFTRGSLFASTIALSIISFLLLIGCIIVAAIIFTGISKDQRIPIVLVLLLIITSLFLLGAFTSQTIYSSLFYSYHLMITAFAFTYLSSILATYWLCATESTIHVSSTR